MKVGILTHYYDSQNFGGNLQAYALCHTLNSLGVDAEQISFPISQKGDSISPEKTPIYNRKPLYKRILRKDLIKAIINRLRYKYFTTWARNQERIFNVSARRKAAFEEFNKSQIPHSDKVYLSNNIQRCVSNYDAFVTGSDQVWNLKWYFKAFFLDFVPSEKKKLSYAASISMSALNEDQRTIFKNSLQSFHAISVREKSAIELIKDLSPVDVTDVLDPVFLLNQAEWDEVSSDRIVAYDYIFCYFLGEDKNLRKLARKFAKKKGLKLVTVPHAGGRIKLADRKFADIQLYDASPNDFVSLIKHAKYILTDSFHAVVFSHIYQKQFFVFNRSSNDDMSSRIVDATEMLGCKERYCRESDHLSVAYMCSLPDIDYTKENLIFEEQKQKSTAFLKNSLGIN